MNKWLKRLKNGRRDLHDNKRFGHPELSNNAEMAKKPHKIIVVDENFTVRIKLSYWYSLDNFNYLN